MDQMNKQVDAASMALRLNQLMVQQLTKQVGEMRQSLATATNMLNDFQYRMLAMQRIANIDAPALQRVTDDLKLADFDQELARKDAEDKAEVVPAVESDDDIVIITSTTPDAGGDHGILRSRIRIAETNHPDLMKAFIGKKVGDKVETELNGMKHVIEILGVRRLPKVEQKEEKTS
jgi:hypothetical protein